MSVYDVICASCGWEGPHTAAACIARVRERRRAAGITWDADDTAAAVRREVAACEDEENERALRGNSRAQA